MDSEPLSRTIDVGHLAEGKISALCVDGAERYCVITDSDGSKVKKVDLLHRRTVASRPGVKLVPGAILTSNGEYWAVNKTNRHLVIFDKNLRIVKIFPAFNPAANMQEEHLGFESDAGKQRPLYKIRRSVFYFNMDSLKLYRISYKTNKVMQVFDIRKCEGNKEHSVFNESTMFSIDEEGRYLLIKGQATDEQNLMLYDIKLRSLVMPPTHIADTWRQSGGASFINKSTAAVTLYKPLHLEAGTHDRILVALGGSHHQMDSGRVTPFVQVNEVRDGRLHLLAELSMQDRGYYHVYRIFQLGEHLCVVLSNLLLKLAFNGQELTIIDSRQLVTTMGYCDLDISSSAIWSVEQFKNRITRFALDAFQ